MYPTVYISMFGFPLFALVLFLFLKPGRAVLVAFLLGYMFLPVAPHSEFKVPGLPSYTKDAAIGLSVLLGVLIFDTQRLFSFRPRWTDLPIAILCSCPFVSSMANDLGEKDGFSACVNHIFLWGLPFFIGRLYFVRPREIQELAIGIFIGGLVYMPLCLLEIRLSPQLHTWVYGYAGSDFGQTVRFGGWRPVVFMGHGLATGMWMSMATLVGFWLWWSGTLKKVGNYSILWLLIPLGLTTILGKSFGALILMTLGMGVLLLSKSYPQRWILLALAFAPLFYIALRIPGWWSAQELVNLSVAADPDRAQSLEFRLNMENILIEKALRKPVFGWAGWGRSRVFDVSGRDISVTDGIWIMVLGTCGFVGLGAFLLMFIVPMAVAATKIPVPLWSTPAAGSIAVLATLLGLNQLDSIPNAMVSGVFLLAAGGLAGLDIVVRRYPVRTRPRLAHRPVGA
jgi:hypothetical protein